MTLSPHRNQRVTASSAGAILGLDPWRSSDDVMRAMVREYHGAEREFVGNVATEWGNGFEDEARQNYAMDTGYVPRIAKFCIHPDHDWLGATPDSLIGTDGLLEIKCPYSLRHGGEFKPLSDQPHYMAQIQVQLECTGRQWCDFYQWSPHGFKLERVYRGDARISELHAFYRRYLVERELPHAERHLEDKLGSLDNPTAHKLVAEYFEHKDAEAKAAERAKEILAELSRLANGKNVMIGDAKLARVERQGAVAYAKIVEKYLPKVDLEPFRGKPNEYWQIKRKGEK